MGQRVSAPRVTRSQTRKHPEDRRQPESDSESEESSSEEEIVTPVVKRTRPPLKTVKFETVKEKIKEKRNEIQPERPVRRVDLPYKDVPEIMPSTVVFPAEPLEEPIPIVEKERAYKNVSKVEEGRSIKTVVNQVLNTPLTMNVGDILAMSKGIRDEMKKNLTRRKLPTETRALNMVDEMTESEKAYWESYMQSNEINDIIAVEDLPKVSDILMVAMENEGIAPGTVIVSDPVVQFLDSIPVGQTAPVILAAKESHALRTVWPVINGVGNEECLLDGGSQIVSMAKEVAEHLELSWDPDICIHMQSANKQIERTLGLARNVPFKFGVITVYLQVHIINSAAYKVLLGRPFDALTQSGYQNNISGGMTMTIKCPNSSKRGTFITYTRGEIPGFLRAKEEKDFQETSRS